MPEDLPTSTRSGGRTPPASPADAVAALARQVERLQAKVDGLDVESIRADLHGVSTTLAGLAEEVGRLAKSCVGADDPAPSWLWPAEPVDQEEATSVLNQLLRWAARVYLRYGDGALPECWLWHPEVIEELVWLRSSWHAAYHGPLASVQRAGDWHDRQRPGVVRRIRAAASSCSLRDHLDPAPSPAVPTADAAMAIAAWWVDPAQSAPAPTSEQIRAADAAHTPGGGWR
jgi:hypothetical protein